MFIHLFILFMEIVTDLSFYSLLKAPGRCWKGKRLYFCIAFFAHTLLISINFIGCSVFKLEKNFFMSHPPCAEVPLCVADPLCRCFLSLLLLFPQHPGGLFHPACGHITTVILAIFINSVFLKERRWFWLRTYILVFPNTVLHNMGDWGWDISHPLHTGAGS